MYTAVSEIWRPDVSQGSIRPRSCYFWLLNEVRVLARLGARPGPSTRSRHCNSRPTGSTEYFGALNRARHQFLMDEVLGLRTGVGPVSRRATTRSSRKVTRSTSYLYGRGRGMSRIDARAAPPMDNAAAARSAGWALPGCERPSTKVAISRHQRLATLDPSSIQKNSSIRRQPEAGGPGRRAGAA